MAMGPEDEANSGAAGRHAGEGGQARTSFMTAARSCRACRPSPT
jgi:hypothetical protein